jgi:hypothetical protein
VGIEGIEEMTNDERAERMRERDREALAERDRQDQERADDNRARQIRQGVISEESEEETPQQ